MSQCARSSDKAKRELNSDSSSNSLGPITENDSRRKQFTGLTISMPPSGKCPFCDWTCRSLKTSTFAMHISRKQAEAAGRPGDPYECSKCKQRFSARTHLNHHVANHHSVNLIDCPDKDCSYKGKNRGAVISHYVGHHMKEILQRCKDENRCVSCERVGEVGKYHIGTCNPVSLFCNVAKVCVLCE